VSGLEETEPLNDAQRPGLRTEVIGWIGIAWGALVLAVLVWQTFAYRGIIASLAEWQFRTFDRFFPVVTVVLLTALLTLPFSIILALRIRRRSRERLHGGDDILLRHGSLVQRFLLVVMAGSAAVAVIVAVLGFASIGVTEREQAISIAAPPPDDFEGLATLRGDLRLDRIGYYRERFLVTGRDLWVAPVTSRGSNSAIRYFVQVEDRRPSASRNGVMRGYLRRSALPGGLERLYRYAGYRIDHPTYVLFTTPASARWPFLSAAADMLILTLIAGIFWLIERWRMRRLARALRAEGHITR
jgi:hypothetical protein